LAVLSGSSQFSHDQVAAITSRVRSSMLVLSSGKSVADYQRLADVTDGDAYYWSSVDPRKQGDYRSKLQAMGAAVHADGKVWIPPFAPGFDARQVGGGNAIDRANGATFRSEYAVAKSSSPDLLGLISWNEFSENTQIEPSMKFGHQYLDDLRNMLTSPTPATVAPSADEYLDMADSSSSGGSTADLIKNLSLLGGVAIAFSALIGFVLVRRRQ
jgi:hypothetical protein